MAAVEFTEEQMELLDRLAAKMGRRTRASLLDRDDYFQEGAAAILRAARRGQDVRGAGLFIVVAYRAMRQAWHRDMRMEAGDAAEAVRKAERRVRPALDRDEVLDVRTAVDALPPRQAEAMRIFYLHDRTIPETAAALGLRDSAVDVRLRRGRPALRDALGPDYSEQFSRPIPFRNPDAWKHQARRIGTADGRKRTGRHWSRRMSVPAKLAMIEAAAELRRRTS